MSKQVNLLRSLEAASKMLSDDAMRELSRQSQTFQKIAPQKLSLSLEQAQYLQMHSAEIARMSQTYGRLRRILKPLIEASPQLQRVEVGLDALHISPENNQEETRDELCTTAQNLVDEVLERGVVQDDILEKQSLQTLTFDVLYYASHATPHDLLDWLRCANQELLSLLGNPDNVLMTASSNLITLVTIAAYIWSVLKNSL